MTVDPAFDTPDKLGEYVRSFDPTFVGLTGDSATLASVRAEFGSFATHTTNHSGEPVLAHTDQVFGIDRSGRLRVLIHADAPAETLEHDIRVLARSR